MLFLLDNDKKRRLELLQVIYRSSQHTINFHDLQTKMKLSTVTLSTTIDQLLEDVNQFSDVPLIVETRVGNQKWYQLPEEHHMIQTQLRQYYLQNSIKFHLMKDLFIEDGGSLERFSQTYFLSPSKITRKVKELNTMLCQHQLQIDGFKHLKLTGSESSLRYFFVHLFFHTYQGLDWPFEQMNPFLVNYYHELFPEKLFRLLDVKGNIFASYIVAISLIRCSQKHYLEAHFEEEWLYEDGSDDNYVIKTERFVKYLLNDPQYTGTAKELTREVRFIYSFVFSQQTFIDDNTDIPAFFFNKTLSDLNYMSHVDTISKELAQLFERQLDERTKRIWRYHLTVIHYRLLLFPEILVTLPAYWTVDFLTIIEKDLYYQFTYQRIHSQLVTSHTSLNPKQLDYLTRAYSVITMPYVSAFFMKHPVNILFLTNNTDFHFLYKAFTSDFARIYLRIEAVEMGNPHTDVIISDTLVNPTLLDLPADTPVIYYETNAYFAYLSHIQDQLFKIQLEKNDMPL